MPGQTLVVEGEPTLKPHASDTASPDQLFAADRADEEPFSLRVVRQRNHEANAVAKDWLIEAGSAESLFPSG